ncbi:sensor histidine kinase [Fretibacter rubidus]|uniref:sensor histidine kinase n=1 Tax=Fretibacter rubidus TaxID=570162 RepID=UPI00352AD196
MLSRIETFLRIDSTMSAANIMRARAIYFTAMIVFMTQVVNQISIYFMLGYFHATHIFSIIACVAMFGFGMALRYTKNFKILTCGFGLVLLFGVISSALPFGRLGLADGINTSMLPILICGTIMGAMMYNWRAPLLFCIPALAVIWGFYALSMNYSRADFIITETIAMMQYVRAFQASLALTVSGVITSYFSYRMYGVFDELEANAEAARRAEGITSQYLADMSHEIRTPLNGIIGLSSYLADADMSPKHKQYVDIIKESGDNLLEIINDVLDLSKLDAGKFTLDEKPFDLHRLCRSLTELHGTQTRAKGVAMQLFYDQNVPHHFIGDDGRIRQILNNLLSNAVKFTQKGSVDLLIKGGTATDGLYTLKIFVRDSGIGIPDAQLPKLFERFEQIKSSETTQKGQKNTVKGTGLGLSITKDLIEYMGGTLHVKSKPGKGTVFGMRLVLPLVDAVQTVDEWAPMRSVTSNNQAA